MWERGRKVDGEGVFMCGCIDDGVDALHLVFSFLQVFSALVVMGAGVAVALMVCCLECARPPRLP